MQRHSDDYPHLDHLLGAYFHQDFAMDGDVDDIIARFVEVSDVEEVRGTVTDIQRFLYEHYQDAETAFRSVFGLTIEPQGWGMNAKQWLAWVERLLIINASGPPDRRADGETHG